MASDRDSGLWIFTYDETGKNKGKAVGKGSDKCAGKGAGKGAGATKHMGEMPAKAKGFDKRSARSAA